MLIFTTCSMLQVYVRLDRLTEVECFCYCKFGVLGPPPLVSRCKSVWKYLWTSFSLILSIIQQIRWAWSLTWSFRVWQRVMEYILPAVGGRGQDRGAVRWGEVPGSAHWPAGGGGKTRWARCWFWHWELRLFRKNTKVCPQWVRLDDIEVNICFHFLNESWSFSVNEGE